MNETFGMGDALFFLCIAVGFPTVTFLILFSFSLFFAITIFSVLKKSQQYNTVPLAGLQSVFLAIIFLIDWSFDVINIYSY
ncbi:hypothetical protein [Urechidicola croceus]|nr:hypothetical protein [Urechidicola croceus]